MNNIESRLQDDAAALEQIKLSDDNRHAFEHALAHTRQDTQSTYQATNKQYGWWFSGVLVASVVAAFLILNDAPVDETPTTPVAERVVPAPTGKPRTLRPLDEFVKLEQVSQAAALEEEWLNIQKDLAQARDTIESELPVRF